MTYPPIPADHELPHRSDPRVQELLTSMPHEFSVDDDPQPAPLDGALRERVARLCVHAQMSPAEALTWLISVALQGLAEETLTGEAEVAIDAALEHAAEDEPAR